MVNRTISKYLAFLVLWGCQELPAQPHCSTAVSFHLASVQCNLVGLQLTVVMLRQLTRLGSRVAAAQQPGLVIDQLQQAPPWQDVLRAASRPQLLEQTGCTWCRLPQQQQMYRIYQTAQQQAKARYKKGITDGGLYLGAVVLGMIGLSYASVPLYRAFCQATGYGGAVGQAFNIEAKLKAREDNPNPTLQQKCAARDLRVWFTSDVADDMPWKFVPTQEYVTVRPGESTLAFFSAHNTSPHAITGVSTYNVLPEKAAYYFNKVQCFCFEEQRLRGGEKVDMPVFFYIDPEMVDDFNCRNIHDITLAYTFFKVDEDEADAGPADSSNRSSSSSSSGVKLHGPENISTHPSIVGVAPPPAATAALPLETAVDNVAAANQQ